MTTLLRCEAVTTCMLARAFVNADGAYGNPTLVIIEPKGATPTSQQRQDLADDLAIPATVFVQDAAEGRVSIHGNYGSPIRFGGHPSLATVDCLHHLGFPVTAITPEAGRVSCRRDLDSNVWLTAPAAWSKPWRHSCTAVTIHSSSPGRWTRNSSISEAGASSMRRPSRFTPRSTPSTTGHTRIDHHPLGRRHDREEPHP